MSVIATIDGMCGTFKSRTANDIASHFNWSSINSGMIYRAITSFGYDLYGKALLHYPEKITNNIYSLKINNSHIEINGNKYYFSNLRTHNWDMLTSSLANEIIIQNYIHVFLRSHTSETTFVVEGREMSTVFPNASFHFYFFANPIDKAMNRIRKNHLAVSEEEFDNMCERIRKRDEMDMYRVNNPLIMPEDAIIVDVGKYEFKYDAILSHVIETVESVCQ